MASFKLTKKTKGEFHFNLIADNNEKVLSSETYKQKRGALDGIESVKKNCLKDERYELKKSKRGQHFFILKAVNSEIIGKSEEYTSLRGAKDGIAVIKRIAPKAVLKDMTA